MAQSDPEYAVINYWKVPVYLSSCIWRSCRDIFRSN